jgi:hypothetical protein
MDLHKLMNFYAVNGVGHYNVHWSPGHPIIVRVPTDQVPDWLVEKPPWGYTWVNWIENILNFDGRRFTDPVTGNNIIDPVRQIVDPNMVVNFETSRATHEKLGTARKPSPQPTKAATEWAKTQKRVLQK